MLENYRDLVRVPFVVEVPQQVLFDLEGTTASSWFLEHRNEWEEKFRQGLEQEARKRRNDMDDGITTKTKENQPRPQRLHILDNQIRHNTFHQCPFHAATIGPLDGTTASSASSSSSLMEPIITTNNDVVPEEMIASPLTTIATSSVFPSSSQLSSLTDNKTTLMLETISKVQKQFFDCASSSVVFDCLLAALLELLDSEYGFIGEIKTQDDDGAGGRMYLQSRAVTNIAWNKATEDFYEEHVIKGDGVKFYSYHSLYGSVMTTGKPVIANDAPNDPRAKGVPEGHPPLNAFLGIPFFKSGGTILGMVGVSNKPGGYSQADIDFLQPFLVTCSNLLYAFTQAEANQRLQVQLATTTTVAVVPIETPNNSAGVTLAGQDATTKMKAMVVSQKNRISRMHRPVDYKPLAELYLETTVLYCNITGFTSWASTREPSQVFTLLETVFGGFDRIARRQGVFKVETVGDRYVAVTGFPDFQPNHAERMAQFAHKCVTKFGRFVSQLEITLGPDTSDLQIRIGIHSGQVLAGVIQGERSRIQLFGDTVNTAAKMEATGQPGKIHISKQTADLIAKDSKFHWIEAADDIIFGGKGKIATYWLNTGTGSNHNTKGPQEMTFREASESTFGNEYDDEMYEDRTNRLIEWNVKALTSLMEKIVAARQMVQSPLSSPTTVKVKSSPKIPALESRDSTFLDEVKEIIELPAYVSALQEGITVEIDPMVEDQLREYMGCIAALYKPNAFHNLQKLLARIASPSDGDLGIKNTKKAFLSSALHDHTYGITSDPLTPFACAFAALIHDVDHEGVPNPRLIQEKPELGSRYRNRSVAEQNSIQIAWDLLMESRFDELRLTICNSVSELRRFRELVVSGVLATDLGDKELKELRNNRWTKAFSKNKNGVQESHTSAINRKATIVIEHLIQASDVAHTMQHWTVYRKWNERLFVEMWNAFQQGRAEVNPASFWVQGEIGFFDFYVIPLAKKLKDCGVFGVSSDEYLNYALQNRAEWENKGDEIVAEMVETLEQQQQQSQVTTEKMLVQVDATAAAGACIANEEQVDETAIIIGSTWFEI